MKQVLIKFLLLLAGILLPISAMYATPFSYRQQTTSPALEVESIEITGNHKTREYVIRSLLDFQPGDRIHQAQLQRNFQRLQESNFFKKVNLYTQPGSSRGKVRVYVEVEERHWPYFQFRGGYSQLDGWYISPLGIRADNLFGRGNYMGAELLVGDRLSGLDISFLRPNIFSSDLNFRLLMFTRNREFLHYFGDERFNHPVNMGGLSVRLTGNHGLMKYLWFEFIFKNASVGKEMYRASGSKDAVPLPPVLLPDSGFHHINRMVISLNQDTRDNRIYPTAGWWGSVAFTQVSKQFGAFADYKKMVLDVRGYRGLWSGWVLAARLNASVADTSAPFYDRYYLGGPNSLRGYADRSLTPVGYASRLVLGSVELRFPITRKNFPRQFLSGVFFYDFGQAWNPPREFDWNAFSTSAGFGFRFLVPFIGVVRMDFAYPLPNLNFMFHISLGHTF